MPLRNSCDKYLSGHEVRTYRVSRNLTQPELARWLGLTPQAVCKYEKRGVSKATALALAALDRGLKPFKPTKDDFEAAETSSGKVRKRTVPE